MQRKILFAAALAMATAIGSQVSHAEDTVAVIVKATTSEYWQWVFKGAEDAGKLLGVKVEKLGTPKDDAAGEIAVLESAAASKPTAVVISPTIFEALGDPIAKVTEAGIPVIVIDLAPRRTSSPPSSPPTTRRAAKPRPSPRQPASRSAPARRLARLRISPPWRVMSPSTSATRASSKE